MRSRTELVTTTFDLDTDEEDYSPDDDDSEEDWRPNKKRQQKQPRANGSNSGDASGGRKRKANALHAATKMKKRPISISKVQEDDFESVDDEEDDCDTEISDEDFDSNQPMASTSSAKPPQSLPPKKQFVKLNQLDLLLKKQDLMTKDWLENSRLCLWRNDEQTNLLQKYLRVKTVQDASKPQEQQLLFTSSSVYSSWDEQSISDFIDVKVNCLDPNNRRIQLDDLESIKKLSLELQATNEQNQNADVTKPNENTEESAAEESGQNDSDDDDDDDDNDNEDDDDGDDDDDDDDDEDEETDS